MLDAQRPAAGLGRVAGLQLRDHLARIDLQQTQLVQRRVMALAHEAPVAPVERQFLGQRRRQPRRQVRIDLGEGARGFRQFGRQGRPVEQLGDQPQEVRDEVFAQVIELVARELFEWGLMQTDPNFANYRYREADRQIVLLDFGATREVSPAIAGSYRRLLQAGLARDHDGVRRAALEADFLAPAVLENHGEAVDRMIAIILSEMARDAPFDFGDRGFVPALRDEGMAIAEDKANWHIPPAETLFVQRKVSGTALLGARIGAVVNIHAIVRDVLARTAG